MKLSTLRPSIKDAFDIRDSFDRLLRRFWDEDWDLGINKWAPKVDLWQDDEKVVVEAELPGVDKKDIDVNIAEDTITIKASSKKQEEKKQKNYYYSERSYGEFLRTIELPAEIDKNKAKATFKDGVLEITLPKTKESKEKTTKLAIE